MVLKFMDGYEVYEVKHPSDKMTRELVDCEAMKIRAIPAFKVRKTDFVSLEGFDFSSYEYVLIDGTMCSMIVRLHITGQIAQTHWIDMVKQSSKWWFCKIQADLCFFRHDQFLEPVALFPRFFFSKFLKIPSIIRNL